ncbi:hypothetical protein VTK73DRAFT_7660 [Phialemonium thermophilum]|uniref:Conserved oligomeric Golgi complex subunit 8 n=1 Tax=Phialemonium thermophilum TaxID=223376 RepID=A0ABR3Y7V2_9PEZI
MAELLYELLLRTEGLEPPTKADAAPLQYLSKLAGQSLESLQTTEPRSLSQASHSLQLSLQSLSKKSHQSIIEAADRHATLQKSLPALAANAAELRNAISCLDQEAVRFSTTYHKSSDNELLARRRKTLLLARNMERVVDVLELPPLIASSISSSPPNYSSALDLSGHVRRLHALYPDSALVTSISAEADEAMRTMAADLIRSLKAPNLKLAASLRTISWLRRLLPDLASTAALPANGHDAQERVLGAFFLICRLATLVTMLEALEPLRELADQEKARQRSIGSGNAWSGGQQTERYLKRYLEIFREQSFAIVSMFRSIFSPTAPADGRKSDDTFEPPPSPLSTFPLHLVDMLLETLRAYLPTVKDQASRDSLLTQVLYCAGSLGRLGGDFGLFLSGLDIGGQTKDEWADIVRRHRLLAGRLESIVGEQKEKTMHIKA